MNVKRNKAQAPVQELLDKCKERETHFSKKVMVKVNGVEDTEVYLSIHMDKQPMVLVHTCSTTGPGPTRLRSRRKLVKGRLSYKQWTLTQT